MGGTEHGRTIPDIRLLDILYLGDRGNANRQSRKRVSARLETQPRASSCSRLLDKYCLGDRGNANKRSVQYNPAPQSSLIGCGPDLRRRVRLK
jgi:hypothetical protein